MSGDKSSAAVGEEAAAVVSLSPGAPAAAAIVGRLGDQSWPMMR